MSSTPRRATVPSLTTDLTRVVARRGADPKRVGMTALCTTALFLGAGHPGVSLVGALAGDDVPTHEITARLWEAQTRAFPYLGGHLHPLVGWLSGAAIHEQAALRDALTVCAHADLPHLADAPGVEGDLLGQALAHLTASGDRSHRGAFFTPAGVASLCAALAGVDRAPVGATIAEPAVGGGVMAVAAVRAMRRAGVDPSTRAWTLTDIDPFAVAVAGVAMSVHGIPWVTLTVGDTLASPGAA